MNQRSGANGSARSWSRTAIGGRSRNAPTKPEDVSCFIMGHLNAPIPVPEYPAEKRELVEAVARTGRLARVLCATGKERVEGAGAGTWQAWVRRAGAHADAGKALG